MSTTDSYKPSIPRLPPSALPSRPTGHTTPRLPSHPTIEKEEAKKDQSPPPWRPQRKNRITNLLLQPPPLPRVLPSQLPTLPLPLAMMPLLALLLLLLPLGSRAYDIIAVLDRDALGHVVDLVHPDQARGQLKHVVAEGDDDELGVFGAFFDVIRDDGDLCGGS